MTTPAVNILLVENEPDISFLVETILKGCGYNIVAVDRLSCVREAILHHGKNISLVLINIWFGGLELMEEIDQDLPWPVLYTDADYSVLSPKSSLYQRIVKLHSPEGFDILARPFDRDELITKVDQLLGR